MLYLGYTPYLECLLSVLYLESCKCWFLLLLILQFPNNSIPVLSVCLFLVISILLLLMIFFPIIIIDSFSYKLIHSAFITIVSYLLSILVNNVLNDNYNTLFIIPYIHYQVIFHLYLFGLRSTFHLPVFRF